MKLPFSIRKIKLNLSVIITRSIIAAVAALVGVTAPHLYHRIFPSEYIPEPTTAYVYVAVLKYRTTFSPLEAREFQEIRRRGEFTQHGSRRTRRQTGNLTLVSVEIKNVGNKTFKYDYFNRRNELRIVYTGNLIKSSIGEDPHDYMHVSLNVNENNRTISVLFAEIDPDDSIRINLIIDGIDPARGLRILGRSRYFTEIEPLYFDYEVAHDFDNYTEDN